MESLILIIMIAAVVFLTFIAAAFFIKMGKAGGLKDYPYRKKDTLFTAAERSFYGVLCQAVDGKAVVFAKVRVGDVLKTRQGLDASERQKAFNRISAKHFDYLLCRPDDLSVLAAVELDDSSHSSKIRVTRDQFLEGACESAKLRLCRFTAARSYNIADVRETLFPSPLGKASSGSAAQKTKPLSVAPKTMPMQHGESAVRQNVCPRCSSGLVSKVAKKGRNKGITFLGCSAFPECRFTAKQDA